VSAHLPALEIGKATSAAIAGAPFTYTLAVTNTDRVADATAVVITDALPAGANYLDCGGGTCAESGGVVTWSGLAVPADDSLDVTFVVTACTGPLVNSAYRVAGSLQGITSPWGAPITAAVQAPDLAATFVSAAIPASMTVVFTDVSTTDGGSIVAWGWDFGDSGSGSGRVVSHTYTAAGAYTVTLTVTDTCSYTDAVLASVAVDAQKRVFLPLVMRGLP
jgi:uncharacterized repeat protein (TIGR01451 family)